MTSRLITADTVRSLPTDDGQSKVNTGCSFVKRLFTFIFSQIYLIAAAIITNKCSNPSIRLAAAVLWMYQNQHRCVYMYISLEGNWVKMNFACFSGNTERSFNWKKNKSGWYKMNYFSVKSITAYMQLERNAKHKISIYILEPSMLLAIVLI